VISIFHETKIPTVDMKLHVYSKFRKNKILKKVKSPISMRYGTFNTSKRRGKLQKMGVLYTHSLKSAGPFQNINNLNKRIWTKRVQSPQDQVSTRGWRTTAGRRPAPAHDPQSATPSHRLSGDQRSPTRAGQRPGVARQL
jgi:hypothetical protein